MAALRRALYVCLLAAFTISAFAWGRDNVFHDPTPEELSMKSVASAPGAHGAILQWDHRQDDWESWESEYVRIKIFDRDAAKYGDIELPYVPGYTWIKSLQARTIHADGTVVPFDGKTYEKLVVKASGVKVMAKTFSLPDIQPGSILEYYYIRAWQPSMIPPTSQWILQHGLPALKEVIWFKPITKGVSSFFTYQGLPAGKLPKQNGDHFELELENMPPYDDEPYAMPERMVKSRVDFYYTFGDTTNIDKFWSDTAKSMADTVEDFVSNRAAVKAEAQKLIAGATTDDEKLHKLYARAQQIRNLSYEPDKTDKEADREKLRDNKSSEDVLRNNYGWRNEITRTFVALARGAGFDANVVRAASRSDYFFAKEVPNARQLDSEIATVAVNGEPRYFDPATPFAPYGVMHWELTGVPGMKLVKKGGSTFVTTPHLAPADALRSRKADLHIEDDLVKGTVTLTYTGEAALLRRLGGRNDDDAKRRKEMEESLKAMLPEGSVVKLQSLEPWQVSDEPLVAKFNVELPNLGSFAGSRALLPLAIFTTSGKNPFSVQQRKHDVYFEYQSKTEDEVVLHLGGGYVVESLPQARKNDLSALKYMNEWTQGDGVVTFKRSLTVNTLTIDARTYAVVRNFYSKVLAADQDTVVLKKGAKS
jgi:hypothetical protein